MPGREVVSRPAAATATARGRRAAGAPYGAESALPGQRLPQKQATKQVASVTPACASCVSLLRCTQRMRQALEDVLANARIVFLDDTLHHQMDDERWLRVLRAMGEDKAMYYRRVVSPRTITPSVFGEGAADNKQAGGLVGGPP